MALSSVGLLAVMAALHRGFVAVRVDREMARAMGLRVFALDLALT